MEDLLNNPHFQNAVEAAIAQYSRNNPPQQGPRGERGTAGQQGPQGQAGIDAAGGNGVLRWNTSDVGFFDPMYDGKSVSTGSSIEHAGKETYFRDVHLFVERLKEISITKGPDLTRDNAWLCLRGTALEWWTAELSENDKLLARLGNGVDQISRLLTLRFKEPTNVAMDAILHERYTMRDAANRREPREYAQKIARSAKDAGLTGVQNQLDIMYNGIDLDLRRDVKRPKGDLSIDVFLTDLDECKYEWWAYAGKQLRRQGSGSDRSREEPRRNNGQYDNSFNPNRQNQNQGSRNQFPYQNSQFPYQNSFPSYPSYSSRYQNNQAYQNRQAPYQYGDQTQGQANPYSNARLPPPSQRLQITAGPANASASPNDQNYGSRQPFKPNPGQVNRNGDRRQGFQGGYGNFRGGFSQRRQSQRAYQASVEDEENDEPEAPDSYHSEISNGTYDQGTEQDFDAYGSQSDDYGYDVADVNFAIPAQNTDHRCTLCQSSFPSKNKLFSHLRSQCWQTELVSAKQDIDSASASRKENINSAYTATEVPSTIAPQFGAKPTTSIVKSVVESTITPDQSKGPGYAFRGWRYATVKVRFDQSAEQSEVCLDTGCSATLADRGFLLQRLPNLKIQKLASPMPVRGVGNKIIKTDEFCTIKMFIDGKLNGLSTTASLTVEAHLVTDLKANMLIGTDTIAPQGICIDLGKQLLTIGACQNLQAPIETVTRQQPHLKRTVRVKFNTVIPSHSTIDIPVTYHGSLPNDRDFLFEPQCPNDLGNDGGVYAHVVDSSLTFVQIRNATDRPITLSKRARLGSVEEYQQHGAYMITTAEAHLAAGGWRNKWKKGITTMAAAYAVAVNPNMAKASATSTAGGAADVHISMKNLDPKLEHVLHNGITVYGQYPVAMKIAAVADEFPEIWIDQGTTIDIPEEEWMPITLKPGADPKAARVYPLGQKDREVIDETFDKMHAQGKLTWSNQPTAFSYPVFVVWRDTSTGRKGRVVVDIRALNKMTETDSYPIPLQSDITSAVAGFPYISTVDGVGYFHQFLTRKEDRHKLTVVSHRGQEQSNVALMGYKGSPPYVQRQTDKLLRPLRAFVRAYLDDMVTFSATLDGHLSHLRKLFSLCREKRISLSPKKSFLGYPSIVLLGQRVDSLGLSTSEEKIAAITSLSFPKSLRDLEIFLGMTGWLRSSIPKYAQRARALQERKTLLTKTLPKDAKGPSRKRQSNGIAYEPTATELESFRDLQNAFATPSFLVHFDPTRKLYVDLDASKEMGYAAMIYHVNGVTNTEPEPIGKISRIKVQPILFLSKLLNSAERNYWPTELEIAGIVWVMKRTRHMIESTKVPPVIIYTDHAAAVPISRQTSLITSSTDKLNLRLVRASQYLSGFNLAIRHKAGKANVVPDALSRLQAGISTGRTTDAEAIGVLEALYGHSIDLHDYERPTVLPEPIEASYHVTLVEMADEFKERLKEAYAQDPQWKKILNLLRLPHPEPEGRACPGAEEGNLHTSMEGGKSGLRFKLREDLLYYTSHDDGRERLCIPEAMDKEIFQLAHDRQSHGGFHRSYDRIVPSIYMRHLQKRLRQYIEHCPICALNQTKRHKPYGSLLPIDRPGIPFHTIAMDFVIALPLTSEGFDSLLTITDKFSKRILLLPGLTTYTAVQWANKVITALVQHDWGVPTAIISDRDSKFMSSFWRTVFQKLGVSLLTSTAYHPQTDGQSERTNQTVEIAIRFYAFTHPEDNWTNVLSYLQGSLNNSKNQSTGSSPNQILYGFNVRDSLGLLTELPIEDRNRVRDIKRAEAEDSVAFANAMAKARYDDTHTRINIQSGSRVFLRLHNGYSIPGVNGKLAQQRVGPFKVIERVGQLAYRLELPPVMRIHPVISIAQLEPATDAGADPYGRHTDMEPPPITENQEGNIEEPEYEIERFLSHKTTRGKRHYLVKWKGYGNEHNVWYSVDDLTNANDLVHAYEEQIRVNEGTNGPRPRGKPRREA